jgi:Fe-S cluster assembly iron-binding protein IscA
MSKPHISNPCHENWDAMTPQSGGRHCDECDKTVIDFTGLTNDEISTYLTEHAGEKICGRFSSDQMNDQSNTSPTQKEQDCDSNIDSDDSLLLVENMVLGMLEPITLDFDIPDSISNKLMGEVEIDYDENSGDKD